MASKVAFLLLLNVFFFTLVSSTTTPRPKTCSMDFLRLKVCANVLGVAKVSLPAKAKCCSLIKNVVDLEAAVCLCTALKANVLGIKLNIPVSLSVVLNHCNKKVPSRFRCA